MFFNQHGSKTGSLFNIKIQEYGKSFKANSISYPILKDDSTKFMQSASVHTMNQRKSITVFIILTPNFHQLRENLAIRKEIR